MATKRLVVHWDSCIFFAWLNNEAEAHGPAVVDGIAEMVADIDSGRIVMITSVQTKTDVYDHKLKTQWARDEFARVLQRPNVMLIIQDERVADKSRDIREHYARKNITLDATDCTQLVSCLRKSLVLGAPAAYAPRHGEKTPSQADRVD